MANLSHFSLDNQVKSTFEIGDLIPFSWLDVVPGDQIKQSLSAIVRLQPLISPIMDGLTFYTRFYYVPYRLLMSDFEKMLIDPDSPLVCPTLHDVKTKLSFDVAQSVFSPRLLSEYNLLRAFGIHSFDSSLSSSSLKLISAFPFFAYQLIYNYYYKDPVLDDSYRDSFDPRVDFDLENIFTIRKVRYLNDYFTSSSPSTQYGSEVSLDMDGNSVIKVNEMRLAEKLQLFKEKLLLHGARYLDFLNSFFGISPSSAVLQQPQYLGGGSSNINVSDVDQMVGNDQAPLANVAGKSASVVGDNGYSETFKEHGIVLGLCFIKPNQSYVCGVPRSFIKRDFYSFFNPTFSDIGMQETYGAELDANRSDVFAYNERYAELKYNPSVICGDFSESLSYWHFGRDIRSQVLNSDFLTVDTNNIPFAVPSSEFESIEQIPPSFYLLRKSDSTFTVAIAKANLTSIGSYDVTHEFPLSRYYVRVMDGTLRVFDFSDPLFKSSSVSFLDDSFGFLLIPGMTPNASSYRVNNTSFSVDYDVTKFFTDKLSRWFVDNDSWFSPDGDSLVSKFDFIPGSTPPGFGLNPVVGGFLQTSNGESIRAWSNASQGLEFNSSVLITRRGFNKVFNHCLASFSNNIEALRPLPKSNKFLI